MAKSPEAFYREYEDNPDYRKSVAEALAGYMGSFDHGDAVRSDESAEIHGLISQILYPKEVLIAEDLNKIVEDLRVTFAKILNNPRVDVVIKDKINQLQRAVIVYQLNYKQGE
jgi:hypothetical protein